MRRTLMSPSERTRIREVLREWAVPRSQIEAILRDGVFGPGTIGTDDEPAPGIGVMVDERRDPRLGRLFEWRARIGDGEFAAGFRTRPPHAVIFLCPDAPQALLALTVEVRRPLKLRRTYLLVVAKQPRIIAILRRPGAVAWLVPQALAISEWAKEGAGTPEELYSCALPVGSVTRPPAGLARALAHVGFDEP
jgi:hypothetical protein